jgi:hypothetical protein
MQRRESILLDRQALYCFPGIAESLLTVTVSVDVLPPGDVLTGTDAGRGPVAMGGRGRVQNEHPCGRDIGCFEGCGHAERAIDGLRLPFQSACK